MTTPPRTILHRHSAVHSPGLERFLKSMVLEADAWRGGEPYDLAALEDLTSTERAHVLGTLEDRLAGAGADWRDVDALAALRSPEADTALARLAEHPRGEIRLRAAHRLAERGHADAVERELVRVLGDAEPDALVDQIMAAAEAHPSPRVRAALLASALDGAPELRVHAAALALYLAGGSAEAFDWAHRSLFLRFGQDDRAARLAALADLQALMPERRDGAYG